MGEERGWTVNQYPYGGEVVQMEEEKPLDRPGKPKRVVHVNWECFEEALLF